ncbi:porin [Massilia putida]|uniref:porin n=1 Tax=Massilia putida TaxID=1141883 RepID=UPI0009F89F42|nr:porin [Massilia putida]
MEARKIQLKVGTLAVVLYAVHGAVCAQGVFESFLPGFYPGLIPKAGDAFKVYGSVDLYLDRLDAGGTTVNRMLSGGTWTSKLGFYGREELGGGTAVFFDLEAGLNADDGTLQQAGTLFNRQSTIAMTNPRYGTLQMGKQFGVGLQLYVDPFLGNAKISPWAYLSGAADLGKGSSTVESRVNKSIVYMSPTIAGLSTQWLYAVKTDRSQGGPATQNRGVNLTWVTTPGGHRLYSVASFNQTWCDPKSGDPSQVTCTDTTVRTDASGAALVYDMSKYVVSASYQLIAPKRVGNYMARVSSLGGTARLGANLWKLSVVYRDTTQSRNHAFATTLGDEYFLSRLTALYFRYSLIRNGAKSAMTIDYASGSPLPTAGARVSDLAVGMYHNF